MYYGNVSGTFWYQERQLDNKSMEINDKTNNLINSKVIYDWKEVTASQMQSLFK